MNKHFAYGTNLSYVDIHFMPQTWNCEMALMKSRYIIYKYQKKNSKAFEALLKEMITMLEAAGVPKKLVEAVTLALMLDSSPNTTDQKSERQLFEYELAKKPHLIRKLIKIYYFDYVTFGFPFPKI